MTDRNVTIGAGPFQPPSPDQVRILRESLRVAEAEADSLRTANRDLAAVLRAHTADALVALVARALPGDDAEVTIDHDDDEIVVTIQGLTINADGNIAPPLHEFELSTTVSFEHNATIRATDEDTARDLYAELLRDELYTVTIELNDYDGVIEEQYSHDAEHGFINVSWV